MDLFENYNKENFELLINRISYLEKNKEKIKSFLIRQMLKDIFNR